MHGLENPGSEKGKLALWIPVEKSRFSVEFNALGPRDAARNHRVRPRKCVFHRMKKNNVVFVFQRKKNRHPEASSSTAPERKSSKINANQWKSVYFSDFLGFRVTVFENRDFSTGSHRLIGLTYLFLNRESLAQAKSTVALQDLGL